MKSYLVTMIQLIIWSGYTLLEWLSKHDQPIYNVLMFFVFAYLAFFIGNSILSSAKLTMFITGFSLLLYGSLHFTMFFFKL